MSELEDSDEDSDEDGSKKTRGGRKTKETRGGRGKGRRNRDEELEAEDGPIEHYLRSELFKVEKHLLVFGYLYNFVLWPV